MDNLKEKEKDKDCTFLKMNQQVANHYYKISSINIFSDEILIFFNKYQVHHQGKKNKLIY